MTQFVIRSTQLYLLAILFVCCYTAPSKGYKRPSPILGLLSSTRQGHPDSFIWDLDSDTHEQAKRFPKFLRTGRSGTSSLISGDDLRKINGNNNMNPGLWFGPRFGRVQKRDSAIQENPWAYIILGESPVSRQFNYAPRLGRESEEMDDEAELGQDARAA